MDIQKIKELALANGFSLKEQASGNMDLHSYVYEFANAIEQAVKAQAVPEWISVNDKMPDEGDEVFVHHYGHIVQATKDQKYSGGFKQRNCYGWEAVSSYISHWMPMSVVLPESYHFYYGKPAKQAQEQSHE